MAIRIVLSLDQVIALGIIAFCILIGIIAYIYSKITYEIEWFKERRERKKRERKENVE